MPMVCAALAAVLASGPTPTFKLPEGADPNEFVQATWFAGVEVEQVEVPAWQSFWRGDETEVLERRRWIRHTVGPRETRSEIAARYGVTAPELAKWNPKTMAKLRGRRYLRVGTKLRIKAQRVPPAREAIQYQVEAGDSWESIAVDHRVDVRELKAENDARGDDSMVTLEAGREITIWIDPALPWTVGREPGPPLDPEWLSFVCTAVSHGHPNKGRIRGEPCLLPAIPELYTRRFSRIAHGSDHAIRTIVTAFAHFRRDTGYRGEIIVGSVSRPRGGRFPPHRSHQSGRDVDIRLPMLPWFEPHIGPAADEVDWRATWGLIDAFLATGQVEMIFLEHDLQRPLYYAALSMGASVEELDEVITWPRRDGKKGKKIVRHSKGHDGHIHVRIKCGPDEPTCKRRRRR